MPLLVSTIYALSLWISKGLSSALPETVYLTVTKDPYIFLIGVLSICLAVIIEIYASPITSRLSKLEANSRQIQFLAVICFVTSAISVWSASGYSFSMSKFIQIFLEGRYALVYPLMLFILALLLKSSLQLKPLYSNNLRENISFILLIASPIICYGLWSIHISWGGIISVTLITSIIGLALLLYKGLNQTNL